MTEDIIQVTGLTKTFGVVTAVDAVDFSVPEGAFFALLGPSGCGKTTILRMLAGLEYPTAGSIRIDGAEMVAVPPNRRPVNMVFQSYAVFPHMSVAENVGYGLRVAGVGRAEIAERVGAALALVRLDGFEARRPDQLSGGQRQRVALARALVKRPRVLLLDEPLSALDANLREQMRLELVNLQHSVGITFVMVTHDQDEALSMADRIAVMEAGRIRQLATPYELYERPANRFVAEFIGAINTWPATVGTAGVAVAGLGELALDTGGRPAGPATLAVRPEKIAISHAEPTAALIRLPATLRQHAYFGNESELFFDNPTGRTMVVSVANRDREQARRLAVGSQHWLSWRVEDSMLLDP
ncbi:MAG: ABC transporter ATP-binding protein [Pseudomonadota bacterium]|nr:ABC transporter ATP-binding protein [Pseudomonadota bacterium]